MDRNVPTHPRKHLPHVESWSSDADEVICFRDLSENAAELCATDFPHGPPPVVNPAHSFLLARSARFSGFPALSVSTFSHLKRPSPRTSISHSTSG